MVQTIYVMINELNKYPELTGKMIECAMVIVN